MPLPRLFRRSDVRDGAEALYAAVVAQARSEAFYAECGVPDTVDGRFDMIALHAFLVFRRLTQDHARTAEGAQALFDVMFEDMDRSLREMGAGDLGVGRRVKTMAKAFYGRIAAYDAGLAGDDSVLAEALTRNLYGTVDPDPDDVARLVSYVRRAAAGLGRCDAGDLVAGQVSFVPPPGAGAA